MKYTARILIIIIVSLVVILVVNNRRGASNLDSVDNTLTALPTIEHCYAQKNSVSLNEETDINGYSFLKVKINGENANGVFENYPIEKDAMLGSFTGSALSLSDNNKDFYLRTNYNYQAEGMNVIEEKYFLLTEEGAQAAYGEMKELDDGNFVYAKPIEVGYSQKIPTISCKSYEELYSEFKSQ